MIEEEEGELSGGDRKSEKNLFSEAALRVSIS